MGPKTACDSFCNMSNMYGYTDYHGPEIFHSSSEAQPANSQESRHDDELESNPLQVGFWMEGDSLAPPCGTGIPTIHKLLQVASVGPQDVLYDLGCGDGRVCIEASVKYQCVSVGVEVEADLVDRANYLISMLPKSTTPLPIIIKQDLRKVLQRLIRQLEDDTQRDDNSNKDDNEDILPLPTVMILYLLPDALKEIERELIILLRELSPGFRIVCNTWGLPSLKPVEKADFQEQGGSLTDILLYTDQSLH